MRVLTQVYNRQLTGYQAVAATIAGAAFTAVCAKIAFLLPGNPVPVTMQVLAVVLCGMVLGSRLGAIAQMQYVLGGILGAPIFCGIKVGPAVLFGPTGGYLIGFVAAAYVTGLMVEKMQTKSAASLWLAGLFGVVTVYTCGVAWLCVLGIPQFAVVFLGLDVAKAAGAAVIASRLR